MGAERCESGGPILVAREPLAPGEIRGKSIAVPGLMTSAYMALRLFEREFQPIVIPFDQIMSAVLHGRADAGLLIHEGQLPYAREGLHKIVDLGEWWHESTGLPLTLGGNAIRRDLGAEAMTRVAHLLKESIRYALEHRQEALEYALRYARDLDSAQADRVEYLMFLLRFPNGQVFGGADPYDSIAADHYGARLDYPEMYPSVLKRSARAV